MPHIFPILSHTSILFFRVGPFFYPLFLAFVRLPLFPSSSIYRFSFITSHFHPSTLPAPIIILCLVLYLSVLYFELSVMFRILISLSFRIIPYLFSRFSMITLFRSFLHYFVSLFSSPFYPLFLSFVLFFTICLHHSLIISSL